MFFVFTISNELRVRSLNRSSDVDCGLLSCRSSDARHQNMFPYSYHGCKVSLLSYMPRTTCKTMRFFGDHTPWNSQSCEIPMFLGFWWFSIINLGEKRKKLYNTSCVSQKSCNFEPFFKSTLLLICPTFLVIWIIWTSRNVTVSDYLGKRGRYVFFYWCHCGCQPCNLLSEGNLSLHRRWRIKSTMTPRVYVSLLHLKTTINECFALITSNLRLRLNCIFKY